MFQAGLIVVKPISYPWTTIICNYFRLPVLPLHHDVQADQEVTDGWCFSIGYQQQQFVYHGLLEKVAVPRAAGGAVLKTKLPCWLTTTSSHGDYDDHFCAILALPVIITHRRRMVCKVNWMVYTG